MIGERFALAEKIADAVLYEGYLLYPYRRSALKNQLRWQFGIVAPKSHGEAAGHEPSFAQSECLIAPRGDCSLTLTVRFLQMQARTVQQREGTEWRSHERLVLGGRELVSWDEGVPRDVVPPVLSLDGVLCAEQLFRFDIPGGREEEVAPDDAGHDSVRLVRERAPLSFTLRIAAHAVDGLTRLTTRLESALHVEASADRNAALRQSLLGCHLLIALDGGDFVSLLDPPSEAAAAARACENRRWWPVLVGSDGARDMVLCAPIILYDYPAVAPESGGDFFDATEIDELLTLRMLAMTETEKVDIAATDEHGRRILERAERTAPDEMSRMHGAVRRFEQGVPGAPPSMSPGAISWEGLLNPPGLSPDRVTVRVGARELGRGDQVRLAPRRRADAMDMFLTGRIATIDAVYQDLENETYVAVTIDDDPGADLRRDSGRFFYFSPHEILPVDPEPEEAP